jgi:hypothetical protein
LGLVVALGLACAQVAHAQDVAQALIDGAPRHVPKGYSGARAARVTLNDDDRRAGMAAGVQVTLEGGDPKGSIRYGIFPSEKEANAFSSTLNQRIPRGSPLIFLQYLPSANCADVPNGGLCILMVGNVVILATASQVDRGASLVLIAAKETVDAVAATSRSMSSGPAAPTQPTGARDGCALLTKAEAAAALGGPVAESRQGGDTCFYGAQTGAGNSVTLQLIDGGRAKFDFDRGRIQRIAALPGIGDDAFVFVSDAGFVQLYFIKGAAYAALTLSNSRDANRLESAKALARKIAARL